MAKRYDPIMCMMVDEQTKAQDANTLYETFAHGNSKHAGVLEMNGKVKVVVWNEGDNPRTGKVTVIGEDTPANRSKAKSMLDSASALDKAIKTCDAVDDIYVRRSNEYYVNVKLGKSNPQISATISRILNKDKRVDGVLGSPGNWDVAIEGKDNAEYIKKILSGVGNIK